MKRVLFFLSLCFVFQLWADVGQPLQVDGATLALWNFDSDTSDSSFDSAPNPLTGTAYLSNVTGILDIDASYANAREFLGDGSLIDFGSTLGSKLDFQGSASLTVEAVIRLRESSLGPHIIFSNDEVELAVIDNKLAGFIRTQSGLKGTVAPTELVLAQSYRVAVAKYNNILAILVDGVVQSSVIIDDPIVGPSYSNAKINVGGNIFRQNFLGFIDDVRISSINRFDLVAPSVTVIKPLSNVVDSVRPEVEFELTDQGLGIDPASLSVTVNGLNQTGLTLTGSTLAGTFDQDLVAGTDNIVVIQITDLQGNIATKTLHLSISQINNGQEYVSDEFTLGLWHMNDFANNFAEDDSSFKNDCYSTTGVATGEGVYAQGKYFANGDLTTTSILLPSNAFTWEGWLRPDLASDAYENILFQTGQIKITRFNGGFIRVVFYDKRNTPTNFESSTSALPLGELHHLAVSWDATGSINGNLRVFVDGVLLEQFSTCIYCDLNLMPSPTYIAKGYSGMMDEVRFSSIARTGYNLPDTNSRNIQFVSPSPKKSISFAHSIVQINFSSDTLIDLQSVSVKLNDVEQSSSAGLSISQNGIYGTFDSPFLLGLNTLDIQFLDQNLNVQKRREYFYYIEKQPLHELAIDEGTTALWHFRESNLLIDSSTSKHTFSDGGLTEGVYGTGLSTNSASYGNINVANVSMDGRAFTLETFIKFETIGLNGTINFSNNNVFLGTTYISSENKIRIQFRTFYEAEKTLDLSGLTLDDGKYHHIAFVYDSSRHYSQLVFLFDGEVKGEISLDNDCDFSSAFTLALSNMNIDELRISSVPRYSFSQTSADLPVIIDTNDFDRSTISAGTSSISFSLDSATGISLTENKMLLNGVNIENVNYSSIGNGGVLSTVLQSSNLQNGTNSLLVQAVDTAGNTQEKEYIFYYFSKGLSSEYESDSNTVALYHFNELVGSSVAVDSSSNGYDLIMAPTFGVDGVFNTTAAQMYYTSSSLNIMRLDYIKGYTVEFWAKSFTSLAFTYGGASVNFYPNYVSSSFAAFSLDRSNPTDYYPTVDGSFHHFSLVVDLEGKHDQMYLLIDGVVVAAHKALDKDTKFAFNATESFSLYSTGIIDEFRFTSKAVYELKY